MKNFIAILTALVTILEINCFNLQCDIKVTEKWTYLKKLGCSAVSTYVTAREIVKTVNNQDSINLPISTYKTIDFVNQILHYVPQNLSDFFPLAEGMQIRNCSLKEIRKSDLLQFPLAIDLNFDMNELQFLPGDLLEGNPELLRVYFSLNRLIFMDPNVLVPATKIKLAFFMSNPCIDQIARTQAEILALEAALNLNCSFPYLIRQKKVNEERIENLEKNLMMTKNSDRKMISCNGNLNAATRQLFISNFAVKPLETFSEKFNIKCKFNSYEKSCEVIEFIVETLGSKVHNVTDENGNVIDQNFEHIQKMSIVDQQTLFLPVNLVEKFSQLQIFSIINSGLFKVYPGAFANLTSLNSLTIAENKLREIPLNFLVANVNLCFLSLEANKIETIDKDAFTNLKHLRELNLKENLLAAITSGVFVQLVSLEKLNLASNKIVIVSSGLFSDLRHLSHLDISYNFIENLPGDLVASQNKISRFIAAGNKLNVIDHRLIRRLMKSNVIDLRKNVCIDLIFDQNSSETSFDSLHCKTVLKCYLVDDF